MKIHVFSDSFQNTNSKGYGYLSSSSPELILKFTCKTGKQVRCMEYIDDAVKASRRPNVQFGVYKKTLLAALSQKCMIKLS